MSRYREIADVLRARIQNGEYPVESQLPGISALQDEFAVRGLDTIRRAQQILVEEGILETRQGVGAFVIGTTSLRQVDVVATLTKARDSLVTAIAAMTAPRRSITIDLDLEDDDTYFVLTDALREWASDQRHEAKDEPDELLREKRLRWASAAETLLDRIDDAL
ncbi:GntR family transcriptional regulator [Amycolatopsis saalfeldensis]|uniref:GntR family transcriptional regulator n=1 Tax=Amycolatopsis saalfeldensis TaxID=394193 RepID=UPI000B847D31|nr:GntR family transcriptional regulator [Amycolatopsis saalfeldensis]